MNSKNIEHSHLCRTALREAYSHGVNGLKCVSGADATKLLAALIKMAGALEDIENVYASEFVEVTEIENPK